jgi:hypothetical protein
MYSPVGSLRITSGFGPRNSRGGRISSNHGGVDFGAPSGTIIRAAVPGRVIGASYAGTFGNLVKVKHDDGTVGYYAHMSRLGARVGQRVERGTPIGRVGSTGRSTGTHLHFEVRRNGKSVNPLPWLDKNYRQDNRSASSPMASSPGSYGGQKLSAEQLRNARTIVSVGRSMGASQRDLVIGLMTAYQESRLRNLNYGDRDSLGLFQQRPSQGWGSKSQVTNPQYSARKFFSTLFQVSGRNRMSLTGAAQAVQRSGFPNAYAQWESLARAILGGGVGPEGELIEPLEQLDGMVPSTPGGGFPTEAVHLPGVPRPMPGNINPEAELDTSQIRDLRDQGPYNRTTNQPSIRNLLYGTEDEEPYNRSTRQPDMSERRKQRKGPAPFSRSTNQPASEPYNLRELLYG